MPQCRHYFQKIILFLGFMLSVSFCFSVQVDSDIKIRDFANMFYIPAIAVPAGNSATRYL